MTLTVPMAPVSGGQRAPTLRAETPQTGAAIADFGAVVQQVGTRLETDRLDREAQQLQLDITRDLGRARLEFEQFTDPRQIDELWPQQVRQLKDQYLGATTENGRPRVDPRLRDNIGRVIQEIGDRHALQLGGRALELRHSQDRAGLISYSAELQSQAAEFGGEVRDGAFADHDAYVDRLVASNALDAEAGARMKLAFRSETLTAEATRHIDSDPAGYQQARAEGYYSGLDAAAAARFDVSAQNALDRNVAAAATEADRQRNQQAAAVNAELRQLTQVANTGRIPAQMAMLDSPEVRDLADPEVLAEASAARALLVENPTMPQMTLAQLNEVIAAEGATPINREWQNQRMTVLTAIRDSREEGLARDPAAHGRELGLGFQPLPDLDPENPEAFREALRQRATDGAYLARRERLDAEGFIPLTVEEQAEFKAQIAQGNPDQRVALARELSITLGPQAALDVSGDRLFGFAGGMIWSGGPEALAREMFRGQTAIAAGNVILPPAKERLGQSFAEIETVFDVMADGETLRADALTAADALYAARGGRVDPAGNLDEDVYRQAVHEALGGTGAHDSRNRARGGVQDIRGTGTILPPGRSAAEVEDALDELGVVRQEATGRVGIGPGRLGPAPPIGTFDPAKLDAQLTRISRTGRPPRVGGEPLSAYDLDRMLLRAVGDGFYVFVWQDMVLTDEGGAEVTFALSDLLREAGE